MLQIDAVGFAYDHEPVLRRISLEAARGAVLGILGPNGSGKTTLLRIMAGWLRPTSGTVRLDGQPLSEMSRATLARRLAVVPQETQLAFDYSALEIALMGRYPHLGPFELEGPTDVQAAYEALGMTGTMHLADRPFRTLSGGEKQRVVIASALAQLDLTPSHTRDREGLLLLDEPTSSLDLGYHLEVAAIIQELHETTRLVIVISTHHLDLAARVCTDLVLLREGTVLASGPADVVLSADRISALYDVEVDVYRHPGTARPMVVPLRRSQRLGRPS